MSHFSYSNLYIELISYRGLWDTPFCLSRIETLVMTVQVQFALKTVFIIQLSNTHI